MNNDTKDEETAAFASILDFVQDLKKSTKVKYKPLALFNRFLTSVTFSNRETITNIVDIFREFLQENDKAILEKNIELLEQKNIVYSAKVSMNLKTVYNLLHDESRDSFWKHLLIIYARIDPNSGAKNVLIEDSRAISVAPAGMPNFDLFGDVFKKVNEYTVAKGDDLSDNPIEVVTDMLKSGFFTDILQTVQGQVQNGQIDMSSMLTNMLPTQK